MYSIFGCLFYVFIKNKLLRKERHKWKIKEIDKNKNNND